MQKPTRGSSKALWTAAKSPLGTLAAGRLRRGSRGQGMVEYALILLLVAMVIIVIMVVLGHRVGGMYSNISNGIQQASS